MSAPSTEALSLSIFDGLMKKYSHHLIPASSAGQEIKGMSGAAVRTAIHRKSFPVPTTKIMGTQMVRLIDLSTFLADPSSTFSSSIPQQPRNDGEEKRKRGQRGPGKRRVQEQGRE
jgi:hypothetical protein